MASSSCRQTGSSRVSVSDPAGVLQDGPVQRPVRGQPAFHPLEVGVRNGIRAGAHHLVQRI